MHFHSTVSDSIEHLVELMRTAADRSDLVLITGGLGPTLDDLTRDAMARTIEVELELDQASLDHLEAMFVKRGRTMPERNRIQAMFPVGSRPLENHCGTAPGIRMEVTRPNRAPCVMAAFPGVPSEMRPMFNENILTELSGTGRVIRHARIHCFGSGESHIEELLGDLTARGNDPEVGITASDATITMRIAATGSSEEECESKIATARKTIYDRLGDLVFGEEDVQLQDVLVQQLNAADKMIFCAEDATSGMMTQWIASVEDSRFVFAGGMVSSPLIAAIPNAPDSEIGTILDVADYLRKHFGVDYVIAIGPLATSDESEIPAVTFAIVGEDIRIEKSLTLTGNPAIMKSRTSKSAMNELRLFLQNRFK